MRSRTLDKSIVTPTVKWISRRRLVRLAASIVAVAAIASGCSGSAGNPETRARRIVVSGHQDAKHVYLTFRNPNQHWRARGVSYEAQFRSAGGVFLDSYLLVDRKSTDAARAACCYIATLEPGQVFKIEFPPVKGKIATYDVQFVRGTWSRVSH